MAVASVPDLVTIDISVFWNATDRARQLEQHVNDCEQSRRAFFHIYLFADFGTVSLCVIVPKQTSETTNSELPSFRRRISLPAGGTDIDATMDNEATIDSLIISEQGLTKSPVRTFEHNRRS